MTEPAVSVRGLGKRYRIAHQRDPYGRLTESLAGLVRAPFDRLRGASGTTSEWFWALRRVDFDVHPGDVVGIVGRNGAGKSTLLKVLSRVTEPSEGGADLVGRVASLLEVGTGFHPELTGRENIYLSGSILGMHRSETDQRFDEIVAFAEIARFLDTPVKRYSSGMMVRLGFAVAAHLEPEILIVDEVLAVGDAAFQRKCLSKMEDVSSEGRTILFVSHNMAAVESLCTKGVLLEDGTVSLQGSAKAVVEAYLKEAALLGSTPIEERTDRDGDGRLRFTGIDTHLRTGGRSVFRLAYEARSEIDQASVSIGLFTERGEGAVHLSSEVSGSDLGGLPREGIIECEMPSGSLLPGRYRVNLFCTVNGSVADWLQDASIVHVSDGDFFGTGKLPPSGYGSVAVLQEWRVVQA